MADYFSRVPDHVCTGSVTVHDDLANLPPGSTKNSKKRFSAAETLGLMHGDF